MRCKFCYATFEDFHVGHQMKIHEALTVVHKLAKAGVEKITFAGGEPLLYKGLPDVIQYSKSLGMTTSIITNGSLLSDNFIFAMRNCLDWVGISVDSTDMSTLQKIGRSSAVNYYELVDKVKRYYKLKINTVVNAFNKNENLNDFINYAQPQRWKVFQALRVEGQNDAQFDDVKVNDKEFLNFIIRHLDQPAMVYENNELMTGSYLLIDPLGRMFENSAGKHTYSDSLITHTVDHCLSQINVDENMFMQRGGVYEW
jgi:radical S-adenosyl methionine domain-containing protein 2